MVPTDEPILQVQEMLFCICIGPKAAGIWQTE
jgi:hypothetical protein